MPTTTFAGTDAAGDTASSYGHSIEHGDLLSSPDFMASVKRGEAYFKTVVTQTIEKPSDEIAKLKASFESAMNTPVTNEELKARLSESLKEANTPNDRMLALQMILEWMRHQNYVILLGEK